MRRIAILAAATALCATAHAQDIPPAIAAAVANPARPATDVADDAARKPAATLAFAGIKPGDKVVDMLPGGGYFTQLFCGVVGPTGHVYQLQFTGLSMPPRPKPAPGAKRMGPPPANAPICPNTTRLAEPVTAITVPEPVDLIWTSRNYHDLHNAMFGKPDMLAVDKAIFNALKPGGLFVVLDHADAPGTGTRDTDTLHRIDPAAVKQEVTAAGFTYVGSSDILHNPDDDHTRKVFDPTLKGHTDQFILKFRRPA